MTEIEFYFKELKSLVEPPFGGLMGDVGSPFIARRKARGGLPIHHALFCYLLIGYGCDVISGNLSKSAFFKEVG